MTDPKKTGGKKSLENLAKLTLDRFGIGARASRTIGDLQWLPAQSYSIQRDSTRDTWHAGHTSALLSDDVVVIAGTQTGGVWLLTPALIPTYRQGHSGVCLSNDWDNPDVASLSYGPDGSTQVYVGCANASALVLIELQPVLGGMVHLRTTNIPLPFAGSINAIAVLGQSRRIVLATTFGVWWSPIPNPVNIPASYAWQMGLNLPFGVYSGLAAGPNDSIAVAEIGRAHV